MAVYFVTGKIRQGKGLFCSFMAMQYYRAGLRVAANFPLDTEKLGPNCTNPITVIPEIPTPEHLVALGRGCPEGEMERFGMLILDEAGTWLYNPEKGQQAAFLDWFIHSGKLGWDVYIQVQDKGLINKDIFNATGEHLVVVQRKDRIRFPVVSDILEIVFPNKYGVTGTSKGILPHLISAKVYIGSTSYKTKPNESHYFFGKKLYGIHPSNHVFVKDLLIRNVPVTPQNPDGVKIVDMRAMYSLLSGKTLRQYRRVEKLNALLHPAIGSNMEPTQPEPEHTQIHPEQTQQATEQQRETAQTIQPEQPQSQPQPAQDAQSIALAIKALDKEEKKKERNKKLKMYTVFILFMVGFWWFAWGWLNEHVFGNSQIEELTAVTQHSQTVNPEINASVTQTANPVTPESFPLSLHWQLAGWLSQSGQGMFILKGSNGFLRYVPSEQPWQGQRTVFLLDGERVTFFSGVSDMSSEPISHVKQVGKGMVFSNGQGGK